MSLNEFSGRVAFFVGHKFVNAKGDDKTLNDIAHHFHAAGLEFADVNARPLQGIKTNPVLVVGITDDSFELSIALRTTANEAVRLKHTGRRAKNVHFPFRRPLPVSGTKNAKTAVAGYFRRNGISIKDVDCLNSAVEEVIRYVRRNRAARSQATAKPKAARGRHPG